MDDVINAAKSFRIMLSKGITNCCYYQNNLHQFVKVNNPPINDVINLGIVPRFIEALRSENETLQV